MTKRIITTILYVVLFFNLIEAKDISTNTVTNTSLALPDKIEFVAYPDTGTNVYLLLDGSREKLAEFKKTTSYFDLERGWLSTIEKTKAIPQTTYTLYQDFFRTGTRYRYEAEYFQKRNVMTSLAMLVLLEHGNVQENIDKLCDYLWNICEETTWVLPAHYARQDVDLFASETAQALAEIVTTLEDKLPKDVKTRVKSEIYRRVLDPYLDHYKKFWWYKGTNNWNGVCNGAIGSTFVLLETDTVRLENAVRTVVTGLDTYITKGFNNDGGTTEGVPYWMFGMGNYIMFADLLYQRTGGKVDILSSNKLKAIAKYPLSMAMGPAQVASFSDSGDSIRLPHGMIKRLSERTACPELLTFLDNKNFVTERVSYPKVLRNIFWWDYNTIPQDFIVNDLMLPQTGVVKLVNTSTSAGNIILVLSAKAGHNAESHNHNDIGSFILRINGETILCDPGSGLYDKDYFSGKRYNNVFANSYGHSVPVINGKLQSPGLKFYGKITEFSPQKKRIMIDFSKSYDEPSLTSLNRELQLPKIEDPETPVFVLEDKYEFLVKPDSIEEGFITRLPVRVTGNNTVEIDGNNIIAKLTIKTPEKVNMQVKDFAEELKSNRKTGRLSRIYFNLPTNKNQVVTRIELRVTPKK